jgi:ATP-dependent DNA ligase
VPADAALMRRTVRKPELAFRTNTYLSCEFCIPTRGTTVPHTPNWLHEIKYDGYRLRVERDGDRVRLFTRNGYDWMNRLRH